MVFDGKTNAQFLQLNHPPGSGIMNRKSRIPQAANGFQCLYRLRVIFYVIVLQYALDLVDITLDILAGFNQTIDFLMTDSIQD